MKNNDIIMFTSVKNYDIINIQKWIMEVSVSKSPTMSKFLDDFSRINFGMTASEAHEKQICVYCHATISIDTFRDELSVEEYLLSTLCQECQDNVFKPNKD